MSLSLHSRQIETRGPLLLVHGGAWAIPDAALEPHREGLQSVLEAGTAAVQEEAEALAGGPLPPRTGAARGGVAGGAGGPVGPGLAGGQPSPPRPFPRR